MLAFAADSSEIREVTRDFAAVRGLSRLQPLGDPRSRRRQIDLAGAERRNGGGHGIEMLGM
jgi:hypothetical protein